MEHNRQFGSYHIDVPAIESVLQHEGYRAVMLQVPDGLMRHAPEVASEIRKDTGIEVVLDGDTCYGACDLAGTRAKALKLDALLHLGHEPIPSMDPEDSVPVHFFHVTEDMDLSSMYRGLELFRHNIKGKKVGIFTTAQHQDHLKQTMDFLQDHSIDVHVGDPGVRENFPGQVLGCSFAAARAISDFCDDFLFLGTGRFHPLGISLSLGKDVWCVDPMSGELTQITQEDREHFLRIRGAQIAGAQDVFRTDKRVGIIMTPKPGQKRDILAGNLERLCQEKGLDPYLVSMDLLSPMKVRSLGFKVAVSTACPRIVSDDGGQYVEEGVILLSPLELRIVLGEAKFSSYLLDEEW
jgi:2-(3-amino-3-carboxypropyl)histidine synthase